MPINTLDISCGGRTTRQFVTGLNSRTVLTLFYSGVTVVQFGKANPSPKPTNSVSKINVLLIYLAPYPSARLVILRLG